jgi:hypothetical protein
MGATGRSETSVDFQRTTRRYIQEDTTLSDTQLIEEWKKQNVGNVPSPCWSIGNLQRSENGSDRKWAVLLPSFLCFLVNEFHFAFRYGWKCESAEKSSTVQFCNCLLIMACSTKLTGKHTRNFSCVQRKAALWKVKLYNPPKHYFTGSVAMPDLVTQLSDTEIKFCSGRTNALSMIICFCFLGCFAALFRTTQVRLIEHRTKLVDDH